MILHSRIVSICHFNTEEKVMITDIRNINIIRLVKCLVKYSAQVTVTHLEKKYLAIKIGKLLNKNSRFG